MAVPYDLRFAELASWPNGGDTCLFDPIKRGFGAVLATNARDERDIEIPPERPRRHPAEDRASEAMALAVWMLVGESLVAHSAVMSVSR